MMSLDKPHRLIILGFILVTIGVLLPFLMVMGVLPAGFFLSFFSYGASIVGLLLGIIGSAMYYRQFKDKD